MGLTRADPRFEDAFDAIICPVCGCDDWVELPREGVHCDECNCKAELRPTMGDRGFIVDFNANYCWGTVDDTRRIPEYKEEHERTAYAKYMGSPGSYQRAYLTVNAFMFGDSESDWQPAWDRDEPTVTA